MALYITDPEMRDALKKQGLDPDVPGAAEILVKAGYGRYVGEQPGTGPKAGVVAAGKALGKAVINTGIGLIDLPGATEAFLRSRFAPTMTAAATAAGESEPTTIPRFGQYALQPSPVEQENPMMAGLGTLGGTLLPFALTEGLAGAAGTAGKVGRIANLSSLQEKAVMVERGAATIAEARAAAAPRSIAAGLQPKAMLYRGIREGVRMGGAGFAQPGDIEDRMANAVSMGKFGAVAGILGAPTGAPRLVRLLREGTSGAIGAELAGEPVPIPGVPAPIAGAITQGLLSQIGRTHRGTALPENLPRGEAGALPKPALAAEVAPARGTDTVDGLVADVMRQGPARVRDRLANLMEPEKLATMPPDIQAEVRQIVEGLPAYPGTPPQPDPRTARLPAKRPATVPEAAQTLNIRAAQEVDAASHGKAVDVIAQVQQQLATGEPVKGVFVTGMDAKALEEVLRPRDVEPLPLPEPGPETKPPAPAVGAAKITEKAAKAKLKAALAVATRGTEQDTRTAERHLKAVERLKAEAEGVAAKVRAAGTTERRRQQAAARLDAMAAEIETRTAALADIQGRVASRQETISKAAESWPVQTALKGIEALRQRLDNDKAIIEDRATAPRKAAAATRALTAQEAVAAVGEPGLSRAQFQALPSSLQGLHTASRLLSYDDVRNKTMEKQRYAVLSRFHDADPTRAQTHPVSKAVLDERLSGRATVAINAALDRLEPNGRSIKVSHEVYGAAGAPRDRWIVQDAHIGVSSFDTPEAAAFAIDSLMRDRASAPDLTPPGVTYQMKLPGNGPAAPDPNLPPSGFGMAGEGGGGDIPRRGPAGARIEIHNWQRKFQPGMYEMADIDAQVRRETGHDLGLTHIFRTALPAYTAAGASARRALHDLASIAPRLSRAADRRIARALRMVDDRAYTIQKAGGANGKAAAEAELPGIIAQAVESAGLSEKEAKFAFGDPAAPEGSLAQSGVTGWFKRLYADLGIPEEQVVGYFPRNNLFVKDLSGTGGFIDPLDWGTKEWARSQARMRGEAAGLADPAYQRILDEFRLAGQDESLIGTAQSYAIQGYRAKHLALNVQEIGAAVKALVDTNGQSMLGPNATEFIRNAAASLISRPSEADVMARASKFKSKIATARKLMHIADKIDAANPAVKPLAAALRHIYKGLAIKGLEGRESGLAAMFLRFHRQSIFGLSPMRALRDSTSTAAFQLYPRFETGHFGRAMLDVLTPGTEHDAMVRRFREAGFLDMDDHLRFEEAQAFRKLSSTVDASLSWMYRKNDTFTRMLAARASELATVDGAKAYREAGGGDAGWSRFMQITGIDTYDRLLSPTTATEIRALLDRGNVHDAFVQVARLHLDGAVFNYLRPNAPQYNRTWTGRLFGQYGTWPINMVNSLWDMYTAPVKHHGATRGLLRGAEIAAKYGIAAEVVYASGAYMGVDLSSWIPFVHNIWSYSGGPVVSLIDSLLEFFQGDDVMQRRLLEQPGKTVGELARQGIPFPASDSLRRLLSQTVPEDATGMRDIMALRKQQQSAEDRWKVILGFNPYARDVHAMPLTQAITAPSRGVQDLLSEISGWVLPPGSEEKAKEFAEGR